MFHCDAMDFFLSGHVLDSCPKNVGGNVYTVANLVRAAVAQHVGNPLFDRCGSAAAFVLKT